jgi:hypothetical protein
MPTVQDIFREYGPAYLEKYGERIPTSHKKVIDAILSCRTSACGMIVYECTGCGKNHHIFRSCGNRHCPTCQNQKGLDWLEHQLDIQVPGPYFMITFTVPENIRSFFRSNQQIAYDGLFRASSESMKKLAKDDKFIGGDVPGFFGVLHTWGRTLNYHPHIHYVVAGGAWSKDDHIWHPSRSDFYVPNKALSRICRAKFKDKMIEAGLIDFIDPGVWHEAWNVNIQPVGAAEQSIRYLSHYVFKVAISDHRIVDVKNGMVTFSYQKTGSRRTRYMKLSALDFMSRFLQHCLPSGFMKIRYYGFMHGCSAIPIDHIRASIEMMHGFEVVVVDPKPEAPEKPELSCPDCGCVLKYVYSVLPYQMPNHRGSG